MTIISFEHATIGSVKLAFALEAGNHVALSGVDESLAGVLLETLLGFSHPGSGQYSFDGESTAVLSPKRLHQLRSRVGVVSEQYGLIANLKVWENVLLPIEFHSEVAAANEQHELVAEALEKSRFSGDPLASVASLSRFERKQVLLARAFAASPVLIVYDRFLEGFSASERQELLRACAGFVAQNPGGASLHLVDRQQEISTLDYVDIVAPTHEGHYVF